MDEAEARLWHPEIEGWSNDILPYYEVITRELPAGFRAVEVGVAHGRSALFFLDLALQREETRCGPVLEGVDVSPCPQALATVRSMGIYQHHQMISTMAARRYEDNSLDFVFIDANHEYEGIAADLKAWCPKVKSGGIIAGHDYQATDWPGVVKAVDEFFPKGTVTFPTRTVWEYRIPQHGDHG